MSPASPSQPSLLAQFSPSELVLLYADRFVLSFPDGSASTVRPLTSQRFVDREVLSTLMVRCLVGALVAAECVRIEALERPWWRGGREVLVHVQQGAGTFPDESPEQRLLHWLVDRAPKHRLLGDGLAETILKAVGPLPGLLGALGRLSRTGLTRVETRRSLLVFTEADVRVDEAAARQLAQVAETDVRARVMPALEALPPNQRALVDLARGLAIEQNADTITL
jgi:hypothetical protein